MPFAHQYVVTRPVKDMGRNLPTMRDPDKLVYFKEELGGFSGRCYKPRVSQFSHPQVKLAMLEGTIYRPWAANFQVQLGKFKPVARALQGPQPSAGLTAIAHH